MRNITNSVSRLIQEEPQNIQGRYTNALLNVAIHRLIHDEGAKGAATILWRLADVIQDGNSSNGSEPIELNKLNA